MRQIKTTDILSIKIYNFCVCFCSFELSCSILEKDNFIVNVYTILSCVIKEHSYFNLARFDLHNIYMTCSTLFKQSLVS